MNSLCLLFVAFVCFSCSFAFPGEYIPKSYYTLDEDGHKSDIVYLRKSFLPRIRRSSPGGAYGGGGAIVFDDGSGIAGAVQAGLENIKKLAGDISSRGSFAEGGGGHSYSASFSSGGNGGGGPGNGPVLYSRLAEGERELVTGGAGHVHASSSANGPNGAVSFSSSSVDSDGKVHYNTQARKF